MNGLLQFVYCFWVMLPFVLGGTHFTKISTTGAEQILSTHSNTKSTISCAMLCEQDRNPECTGFQFKSNTNVCDLYQGIISQGDSSGHVIYKKNGDASAAFSNDCTTDGFQLIEYGGLKVCYKLVELDLAYSEANSYCEAYGGYLLNLDDIREYDAVTVIFTPGDVSAWVGANDIQNEGQWVRERDGNLLDPDLLRWNYNEPNDSGYNEDCAMFTIDSLGLNDKTCTAKHPFLCEKTVVDYDVFLAGQWFWDV